MQVISVAFYRVWQKYMLLWPKPLPHSRELPYTTSQSIPNPYRQPLFWCFPHCGFFFCTFLNFIWLESQDAFLVWLVLLSIIYLRFTRVVACITAFFLPIRGMVLCGHTMFYPFSFGGSFKVGFEPDFEGSKRWWLRVERNIHIYVPGKGKPTKKLHLQVPKPRTRKGGYYQGPPLSSAKCLLHLWGVSQLALFS